MPPAFSFFVLSIVSDDLRSIGRPDWKHSGVHHTLRLTPLLGGAKPDSIIVLGKKQRLRVGRKPDTMQPIAIGELLPFAGNRINGDKQVFEGIVLTDVDRHKDP